MGFDVSAYLSLLTCVLLAGVVGLLLVLAQQVRALRREAGKLPLLQDDMGRFLMSARQGVEELKTRLVAVGPKLEGQLSDADKRILELDLLLGRAEKIAAKLEAAGQPPAASEPAKKPTAEVTAAKVEVVSANSGAAREPKESSDPLESLLAGLKEARSGVTRALAEGGVQNPLFESAEIVPLKEPARARVVSRSEEAMRAKLKRKSA